MINDNLIPVNEKIVNKNVEIINLKNILKLISNNKMNLINEIIELIRCRNSKSELINLLLNIIDEIIKNEVNYDKINEFEKANWEETFTKSEKIFLDYLKNNLNNNDIINFVFINFLLCSLWALFISLEIFSNLLISKAKAGEDFKGASSSCSFTIISVFSFFLKQQLHKKDIGYSLNRCTL